MSTTRITTMTAPTSSRRLRTFVGACMLLFMMPTMAEDAHVVYAYGAEAVNLDAADAIDGPSFDVVYNIHEGLVGLSETGEIVPVLATSWSLSDDRLSWTFILREGVKLHDGTDFDADVVKFNFDRVMDAANELGNVKQWEPHIASVEVVDAFTVRIDTKKPYGSLLSLLASDFGKLMNSPDAVAQHGDRYGRNPVGTGPFVFESWNPGVSLVLKKNPDYWGGAPAIGSVEYRPSPEGSARVLALESGDVDLINQVPAQDLARLQESDAYDLSNRTISRLFYWAFNHTKDVWSNPRVRIALNRAVDRQSIVDNVLYGAGEAANSYISPTVYGSIPIDVYGYDPAAARKMLEEANFPFDRTFVVYITEGRYYQDRQVAEVLQGMLQEIGLKIQLEVIEWGAFVDAVWFTPAEDAAAQARDIVQTSYGTEDPPTWMRQTLTSYNWPKNGFNEAFYGNEEVDRLIDASNESTNLEERKAILADIQQNLIEDPPWLITHFEQAVVAHKARLTGLTLSPAGRVGFKSASMQ